MMLAVQGIDAYIERTQILRGVSLSLEKGQMAGLVGRNGAGKTTLMRTIMGALKPANGTVHIAGNDKTHAPAYDRARLGVGYMPEDRRLVPELTVEENIMVPAWATNIADASSRLKRVFELLPEIARFAERKALALSGGQQKLVALGRALMVGQQLILLDEPFEGIAPALAQRLVEVLHAIKGQGGLSILLSESDYTHSAGLIDRLFVIERGSVTERAS
jgi:branched-chain amino acid transport system ATP-binding protein